MGKSEEQQELELKVTQLEGLNRLIADVNDDLRAENERLQAQIELLEAVNRQLKEDKLKLEHMAMGVPRREGGVQHNVFEEGDEGKK